MITTSELLFRNENAVSLRDIIYGPYPGISYINNNNQKVNRLVVISNCKRVVLDNVKIFGDWNEGPLGLANTDPSTNDKWMVGLLIWNCDSVVISNTEVSNVTGAGIQCIGCRNVRIYGNHIHDCGRDGIAIYAIARTDGYFKPSDNISIYGNTCNALGDDGIAVWNADMMPWVIAPDNHVHNVSITNNTINIAQELHTKMAGRGIAVGGLSQFTINSNVITNSPYSGILCTTGSYHNFDINMTKNGTIVGNTITNAGRPLNQPEYLNQRINKGDYFRYGIQLFGKNATFASQKIVCESNSIINADIAGYKTGLF